MKPQPKLQFLLVSAPILSVVRKAAHLASGPVAIARIATALLRHRYGRVVYFAANVLKRSVTHAFFTLLRAEMRTVSAGIEFAFLKRLPSPALKAWGQKSSSLRGIEILDEALRAGHGVMVLHASFTGHYYGLLKASLLSAAGATEREVVIVQPETGLAPLRRIGFFDRLEAACMVRISTIVADDRKALVSMGRALNRGAIVAVRIDSMPVKTNTYLISDLFNRPSVFPANVVSVAQRFDALVVFAVTGQVGGKVETRIFELPQAGEDAQGRLASLAESMNGHLQNEVLRQPHFYTSWYALYEKDMLAREAIEASAIARKTVPDTEPMDTP